MRWLLKIIINAVSVVFAAYLLPNEHVWVDSPWSALWVAIVLSILNVIIRPLLIFFTLPATIFTFGLFLLVINAVIILLADYFATGFHVDGFWWALLFSVILWLVNSILNRLLPPPEDPAKGWKKVE